MKALVKNSLKRPVGPQKKRSEAEVKKERSPQVELSPKASPSKPSGLPQKVSALLAQKPKLETLRAFVAVHKSGLNARDLLKLAQEVDAAAFRSAQKQEASMNRWVREKSFFGGPDPKAYQGEHGAQLRTITDPCDHFLCESLAIIGDAWPVEERIELARETSGGELERCCLRHHWGAGAATRRGVRGHRFDPQIGNPQHQCLS